MIYKTLGFIGDFVAMIQRAEREYNRFGYARRSLSDNGVFLKRKTNIATQPREGVLRQVDE